MGTRLQGIAVKVYFAINNCQLYVVMVLKDTFGSSPTCYYTIMLKQKEPFQLQVYSQLSFTHICQNIASIWCVSIWLYFLNKKRVKSEKKKKLFVCYTKIDQKNMSNVCIVDKADLVVYIFTILFSIV